jgi:hypothetical protein
VFGRKKDPADGAAAGTEPFPVEKIDRALDAAIRLFTRVLDQAGLDCGYLPLRGSPVPADVGALVANCTTYLGEADGAPTYLVLGVSHDFESFNFAPQCRLFFVLNAVGLCENPHAAESLPALATVQLPGALVDAWLLRRWAQFMLRANAAVAGGAPTQEAFFSELGTALGEVVSAVPPQWREALGMRERFMQFADGFPVGVGQPLDESVRRMNGLPVTQDVSDMLIQMLGNIQARGLADRR